MVKLTKYRAALREALYEEMERDSDVILMGQDVGALGGSFAVSKGLLERFGNDRVIEMPISESAIVGEAFGMAISGLRPVAELMFADFIPLAMDQIVNGVAKYTFTSAGKEKVPLVIRTPYGIRRAGGAHHSQSPESWVANVPGLLIAMPSNSKDAKALLKSSIRNDNPVIFLEHKGLYSDQAEVGDKEFILPFGIANVVKEGRVLTIVATGAMVKLAIKVSIELEKEDISCEIIDPRTIYPFDTDTITKSIKKTGRVLVLHESPVFGGFGGEIISQIINNCFYHLLAPPIRMGGKHMPIPFSPQLEQYYLPTESEIINVAKNLIKIS